MIHTALVLFPLATVEIALHLWGHSGGQKVWSTQVRRLETKAYNSLSSWICQALLSTASPFGGGLRSVG